MSRPPPRRRSPRLAGRAPTSPGTSSTWRAGERKPGPEVAAQPCARAGQKPQQKSRQPATRKTPTRAGEKRNGATAREATPRPARRAPRAQARPARWQHALRLVQALARAPGFLQFGVLVVLVVLLVPSANWLYQVARKPTELFFPVSGRLFKMPVDTWQAYGALFRLHSTSIMTPELLAALAQTEASGNPVARTYWRWAASLNPFEIYRPASSAVGMYQFTDATFDEARRYCVHDHHVVADGPWHDWNSCWFNALYARVLPSHAIELAASNLDRRVRETLARKGIRHASLRQQQELAIVTHLCGAGAAAAFASRGLRVTPGQHCGTHDLRHYIDRVLSFAQTFATLARHTPAHARAH